MGAEKGLEAPVHIRGVGRLGHRRPIFDHQVALALLVGGYDDIRLLVLLCRPVEGAQYSFHFILFILPSVAPRQI